MTHVECPVCTERFGSESAVRNHCWDVHGACHHCGDEFDRGAALHTHWLAVHDGDLSRADRARAESDVGGLSFGDRLTHQGPASAVKAASLDRRSLIAGGVAGAGLIGGGFVTGVFGGDGEERSERDDHPAAAGLDDEPTLGPAPDEAEGTIVAFEDPSCPSCARFERETFPELEAELVDTGRVSFAYRGIPVVREWADPAVLALEATYDRSPDAFWALKEFYYRSQSDLGSGTVRSSTREFLADRTAVDAAAVLDDVERGTYREAVTTDLQASRDAGVRGTPTFFLFREGSFVTELVGPQSYSVFANSLGV